MSEVKQLPDTGTRKHYKTLIFALSSTAAVVVIIAVMLGNLDREKFDMVMEVLAWWATLAGSIFLIYSGSENFKKQSFAYMNRE